MMWLSSPDACHQMEVVLPALPQADPGSSPFLQETESPGGISGDRQFSGQNVGCSGRKNG